MDIFDSGQKFCSFLSIVLVDDVFSIYFICKLLIVANFKPWLRRRVLSLEAEQRPLTLPFWAPFLWSSWGKRVSLFCSMPRLFFIGIVVTTAGCLVGVATNFVSGIVTVGFLVGVDALAAPFLVGIEAMTVSFLGLSTFLTRGLVYIHHNYCNKIQP
jgi:hypothetical protein